MRNILAQHMRFPAAKLLPDDDFMRYWHELDAIDLITEIETAFGVKFSDADLERTRVVSIRTLLQLVQERLPEKPASP